MKPLLPTIAVLVLSFSAARADDALQEVGRAEALESTTEIVLARNTGKSGAVEEKQKEGYTCLFHYEVWLVESKVRGTAPWKRDDSIHVFHSGQSLDCCRGHEYQTKGLDIGLMLPTYRSTTQLATQGSKDARGILLGRLRGKKDIELVCAGAIERPDQADSLGLLWDRHANGASIVVPGEP